MGEITNGEELKVLRLFAAGEDLKSISKAMGFPVTDGAPDEVVVGIVSSLAGFQRKTAQELVRRAEAKMAARNGTAPDLELVAKVDDPISALLDKVERSGNARLVKQAERIRQSVATLTEMLAGWEQRAQAEQRVAELRRQLAEAEAQLRRASGSTGPTKAAQRGQRSATAREIRKWAAENGIECNALGIIPTRVVEAYRAAHPEAA